MAIRSAEAKAAGPETAAGTLTSGDARAGRPLIAGPKGRMPEPMAPRKARREDRHPATAEARNTHDNQSD